MSTKDAPGWALVTGASSGIGSVYADRLAKQGYNLVLVARNGVRLAQMADRLEEEAGAKVEIVSADLTLRHDLARVEDILRNDSRITLLVNNAGVGATAPLLDSDVDKMSDMVALNVTAPMRLAYAVAPSFAARARGAIINIASIVAIAPEILNGVYGGSKAFVLAFSRSLRHELDAKGVRIQVVLPGATATDFWETAGTPVQHLPSEIVMRTDEMVDAALAGFAIGEFVTVPSLPDTADWEAFEKAREVLVPNLSRAEPADRYRQSNPVAA